MKVYQILLLIIILILSACQTGEPVCEPGSITYLAPTASSPSSSVKPAVIDEHLPVEIDINGKALLVDQIVQGPLCGGDWSGTVYVDCDIEIMTWEEEANFLESCDLNIKPGTVVYVAAHNNEPYYKGCSCHTGQELVE
jgi:hypothetical protein